LNKARIRSSSIPDKAIALTQEAAEALVNPKAAIKRLVTRSAAGKLAKSNPYSTRKADLDFLDAYNDLKRAELPGGREFTEEESETKRRNINHFEDRIEEMKHRRQSMKVAWVTARHVQRVRIVDAIPPPPFPEDSIFETTDDYGHAEFQWGKWIAYVSSVV
jgi:hypothetical protein